MDKLKVIMPKVFVELSTLLLLTLAVSLLAEISILEQHGILLGVIAGSLGYSKLKSKISQLPGLRG